MTVNEKEALLVYLEARLVDLCADVERNLYDAPIGSLYDGIYDILADMEMTLETQIDLYPVEKT